MLVKFLIILFARIFERVAISMIALDNYSAGFFAASSTAGDLGEELKCPFGCAEIGHAQTGIDRNHTDQRHVMKVVTLGNHLRSYHEVNRAAREFIEKPLE